MVNLCLIINTNTSNILNIYFSDFLPETDKDYSFSGLESSPLDLSSGTNTSLLNSGEMKGSCPVCGKMFKHNWQVKRHMSLHTGIKPYHCQYCDFCCAHKYHLKSHMVKHLNKFQMSDDWSYFNINEYWFIAERRQKTWLKEFDLFYIQWN